MWLFLDMALPPSHRIPNPENSVPIQIMSDLHLEFYFLSPGKGSKPGYEIFECPPAAPVLALLGDIGLCAQDKLFDFLERQLEKYEKILYVMGNHEGYKASYEDAINRLTAFSQRITSQRITNSALGEFVFLNRVRYDLSKEITVLGCTLWSHVPETALYPVSRGLNDFHQVKHWTINDYINAHAQDVKWLEEQCMEIKTKEPARRIIILTHHAPTFQNTSAPQYRNSPVASAFATEMTDSPCWGSPVVAWAFGHTHFNTDFMLKGVRVVSNQRGYEGSEAGHLGFSAEKILLV